MYQESTNLGQTGHDKPKHDKKIWADRSSTCAENRQSSVLESPSRRDTHMIEAPPCCNMSGLRVLLINHKQNADLSCC